MVLGVVGGLEDGGGERERKGVRFGGGCCRAALPRCSSSKRSSGKSNEMKARLFILRLNLMALQVEYLIGF